MLEDKINKDTLKIESFNDVILREYDIRGLVGKNLTINTAYLDNPGAVNTSTGLNWS